MQSLDEYKRHDISVEVAAPLGFQQRLLETILKQVSNRRSCATLHVSAAAAQTIGTHNPT